MKHRDIQERKTAYVLILPGIIATSLLILYPFGSAIYLGFTEYSWAFDESPRFVGLQNYTRLLFDRVFGVALQNSLVYTFFVVILQFVFGFGVALCVNVSFPGRNFFRGLTLIPWLVPTVVAALIWRWMYSFEFGIINHFLSTAGILRAAVDWLGNRRTALLAVIVVDVWKAIPFMAVMLLAGLQSVSRELYDVAKIDGCNIYQEFRYVTLPSMKGIIVTALILRTIWTLNRFDVIYLMTAGGPANATQILPTYAYVVAFSSFNMGKAAAITGVLMVLMTIATIGYFRIAHRSKSVSL